MLLIPKTLHHQFQVALVFRNWRVAKLKAKLQSLGLSVTGKKQILINRIRNFSSTQEFTPIVPANSGSQMTPTKLSQLKMTKVIKNVVLNLSSEVAWQNLLVFQTPHFKFQKSQQKLSMGVLLFAFEFVALFTEGNSFVMRQFHFSIINWKEIFFLQYFCASW